MKLAQYLKTVVRVLVLAAAGFIVGIMLYCINSMKLLGNPLPMPFGYGWSIVLSGSMEPTLSVDDLIIIQDKPYEAGDIVVYQYKDTLIVHRLIAVTEDALVFQGDANNAEDEPVLPEQVKGVVVSRIKEAGKVVSFLQSPFGLLACAVVIYLLLAVTKPKAPEDDTAEMKKEIEALRASLGASGDIDGTHAESVRQEEGS